MIRGSYKEPVEASFQPIENSNSLDEEGERVESGDELIDYEGDPETEY